VTSGVRSCQASAAVRIGLLGGKSLEDDILIDCVMYLWCCSQSWLQEELQAGKAPPWSMFFVAAGGRHSDANTHSLVSHFIAAFASHYVSS
jgi:hypothetical protein